MTKTENPSQHLCLGHAQPIFGGWEINFFGFSLIIRGLSESNIGGWGYLHVYLTFTSPYPSCRSENLEQAGREGFPLE